MEQILAAFIIAGHVQSYICVGCNFVKGTACNRRSHIAVQKDCLYLIGISLCHTGSSIASLGMAGTAKLVCIYKIKGH